MLYLHQPQSVTIRQAVIRIILCLAIILAALIYGAITGCANIYKITYEPDGTVHATAMSFRNYGLLELAFNPETMVFELRAVGVTDDTSETVLGVVREASKVSVPLLTPPIADFRAPTSIQDYYTEPSQR